MAVDPTQVPPAAAQPAAPQVGQTQPGTAPATVPSGAHATPFEAYQALQGGYFGPLSSPLQPAMPQLDDPTMQALAQRIQSLRDSHSVLNGTVPPDPASVIARQTSHLSALQIASQVGQQTWQQSVIQPFQDFVSTWQHDWKTGLLETVGGAAMIAGAIGLSAIGAAPVVFAIGAALVAPGMIKAWGDELQHPTDSNLVKALVSTSTGIIAVGVPVKWAEGMTLGRNSLSFALRAKKELLSGDALLPKMLSGKPELRNELNLHAPIEEQMDTLAARPGKLRAQFKKYGVDLKDKRVDMFLKRADALEGMRKARVAAKGAGDDAKVSELDAEMTRYASSMEEGDYLPLRLQVASHYLFLPDNKFKHIPLTQTAKSATLPALTQVKSQRAAAEIMGFIRQIGRGHGLEGEHDLSAKSAIEHQGRDMLAGGAGRNIARMNQAHDDLVGALGLDDKKLLEVEIGMEDPAAWEKLSGEQQLYGQYRATMQSAMTLSELRWGTIENAIAGYLPRMFTGAEDTDHTAGVKDIFASLKGSMVSRSRIYKAALDAKGDISYYEKSRAQLLADEAATDAKYKAQRPLREYHAANEAEVKAARKKAGDLKRVIKRYQNAGKLDMADKRQAELDRHYDVLSSSGSPLGTLAQMSSNEYEAVQRLAPLQRKLVTGTDLFRASTAGFQYRMEEAALRAFAETHANSSAGMMQKLLGKKVPLGRFGLEMQQPEFKGAHDTPDFMPETAFARGKDASKGYKEVFRAIGRPGELHHRPALYARDELADELHKIMDSATTGSETFSGFSGALYKLVYGSKRMIMATPFWHAMNVGGRAIAFILDDPVGANTALSTVWGKGEHLLDAEARATLEARASQNGLLHANRFEVTNQQHRKMRDQDGQSTWPTALRTLIGPLSHAYQDMLEGGFWKMVDDLQLAGFQLAEHKMRLALPPGTPEAEIGRLAGEYANNLAGMVNPLYMNKVYRHARNLIFFAPSYWATFMRMTLSLPGADRMSGFLAKYRGGEFVRFGNVPMKAVSQMGRRELSRMQRSWTITYLATAVTAADMMNVMLGGRHLWENDQGRMFDINVDHFAAWSKNLPVVGGLSPGGPETLKSGEVRHTYFSAMPFFRQATDVMNTLGLGHDWGLAHQLTDSAWLQADGIHKAMMAAGALADGVRRQGANKLSGVPQAAYGGITGEELSSRLGQGVQRKIQGPLGTWGDLLALVPGGMSLQRFWSQEIQAQERTGQPTGGFLGEVAKFAPSGASALMQQFTGFPSMYHMGPEQPPIDDSKMQGWYKERNSLHDALQNASKQLFMGDMSPLGYQRKRQQLLDRLIELDSMTFGSSSPAAPLAAARADIASGLGLDNLGLSDSDWYARYQQFQQIWDHTLQSASPTSRAAWWEAEHSQWTDADYLVWEAQEMKKSIAAAVDGQGGAYIAAYENQIAALQNLPMTTAERIKLEESDPYYYTYRQIIKGMAGTSALGAFVNAFTSPYSQTTILEQGLTPAEQEQAASLAPGSASLIKPETAAGLAADAKKIATSPEVGAAGGQATASPEFDAALKVAAEEAQSA